MYRKPGDSDERGKFELVTYGRGGGFSRYNLDKTSALLEMDDLERFGEFARFEGLRWSHPLAAG